MTLWNLFLIFQLGLWQLPPVCPTHAFKTSLGWIWTFLCFWLHVKVTKRRSSAFIFPSLLSFKNLRIIYLPRILKSSRNYLSWNSSFSDIKCTQFFLLQGGWTRGNSEKTWASHFSGFPRWSTLILYNIFHLLTYHRLSEVVLKRVLRNFSITNT